MKRVNFGSPYLKTERLFLGLAREQTKTSTSLFATRPVDKFREEVRQKVALRKYVFLNPNLPPSNECQQVPAYATDEVERLVSKPIKLLHTCCWDFQGG
jgi:hypothetical protein